jgi:hypothetical protein
LLLGGFGSHAAADAPVTAGADALRTSWYSNQAKLTPGLLGGGSFGKLFSQTVTGQVYAQPLVADGTLLIATEDDWIYGLDPRTGAIRWSRNVGTPFNASDVPCTDLVPHIGVTSTPVIDPAGAGTAYFTAKSYDGSGNAVYSMHAVDLTSGAERANFPVQLGGTAQNDPSTTFGAKYELQRPALLLLDGVVYAAFGGHCDHDPYQGWVFGVNAASGAVTARWTDEDGGTEAGIWQSGGGLVSDGPGQILLASGNGDSASPGTAGHSPPGTLGESLVRLQVQGSGQLQATDFFAPFNAATLNSGDTDFGSGAPIGLPSPFFGTVGAPNLMVAVGKEGYVYLLDGSDLGGIGNGPSGSDQVVQRVGPNGGVWARPAVWPGDGGWVYMPTAGPDRFRAYSYGVSGSGNPTLTLAGTSSDAFGFSSSGPVVTSNGTTTGSAIVWVIWTAGGTGNGAELRAYAPVPVGGAPQLLWSVPIGQSAKFNPPGVGDNRIYVGTRDGHVMGFGPPLGTPLSGNTLTFPPTTVGKSRTLNAVLTASEDVTLSSAASTDSHFAAGPAAPALPKTLHDGETLTVPVTFSPSVVGPASGALHVETSAGEVTVQMSGQGQRRAFSARVSKLSVRPSAFRVPRLHASKKNGTVVRYAISTNARVRFRVEKRVKCRPSARHCKRYRFVRGSFSKRGRKGRNHFRYLGRMRGRGLKVGRYLLVATPVASDGRKGKAARAHFKIIR